MVFFFLSPLLKAGKTGKPAKVAFPLSDLGTEFPVDFNKYGKFTGEGTTNFKYKIIDRPGLARAMGAGLYPNGGPSLEKDTAFQKWKIRNARTFNHWDYVDSGNPQNDFYGPWS